MTDHPQAKIGRRKGISYQMLLIMVLALLQGFELAFIPTAIDYILFFVLFFWGQYWKLWSRRSPYTKPINLYIIFLLISFLHSMIYRGQNPIVLSIHSYMFFGPVFYFLLLRYMPSTRMIERIFITLGLTYTVCYLLQVAVYPHVLFDAANHHMSAERVRMRLSGTMLCYVLYFLGLNKYLLTKKKKFIIYMLLGFIPILFMGFRSVMLLTVAGAFAMIPFVLRSTGKTIGIGILGLILVAGVMQTGLAKSKMAEMAARSEREDTLNNDNYIRLRALAFFWDYFDKPGEKFWGAGLPNDWGAKYTKDIHDLMEEESFYWMDLGITGFALMVGFPAVFMLVYMYVFCMWNCNARETQFVRFALGTVLVSSIVLMELYREGNLILVTLLFYYQYKHSLEHPEAPKPKKL